ncbi:MAG: prephenate dehydratase [Clostridia bacterium]|nr:prephenate dehydratase [Clostridia bacterium]
MKKIGYLGPRGTFSHEALKKYINGREGYNPVDYSSIPDMIIAVQKGHAEEALVPIENSIEGAVNATLDILAADVELMIKTELVIAVSQNLLVRKGTHKENIKLILSHPQPIGQCTKYLQANFQGVETRYVFSTAGAALEVSHGNGECAAIGSATAAEEYGLEILARGIQDNENNLTRFVAVSKQDSPRSGCDKTSIVFSTDDKPGSLYRILDIFNLWDINMSRIESRPAKNQLGKYIFFVDINGHREDEDIRDALTMVKRKTSFYKFLGSYPVFLGN